MSRRALALIALAAALLALALAARRPPPVSRPAPPRRRRPLRRFVAYVASAALVIGVAAAGVGGWRLGQAAGEQPPLVTATPSPRPQTATPTPTPTATPTPVPSWRLFVGGDVLMDLSEAAGFDPFARLRPPLAAADLALVNVEMAIATGGSPEPKSFVFRAPPSAADTMAAAGVDVGNLGNNHALDFGVSALDETIANLRRAGVAPVGAGDDANEAYAPASFEIKGVRVGVIGASRVFPRPGWAARGGPGLASAYDEARLLAAVRSAKAAHDVVIVLVHWGEELAPCPNEDQRRLGAALIDAGASLVLGSHPHVLQPVVRHGEGLIAYSLGNFVWHPRTGPAGETGVLEARFEGPRLRGYAFHPHLLDERGAPAPADPAAAARIEGAVRRPCG